MSQKRYTKEECVEAIRFYEKNVNRDNYTFDMTTWGDFDSDNNPVKEDLEDRFSVCGTAGCLSGTIALYHGDPDWANGSIWLEKTIFGQSLRYLFSWDHLDEKGAIELFWKLVELYD